MVGMSVQALARTHVEFIAVRIVAHIDRRRRQVVRLDALVPHRRSAPVRSRRCPRPSLARGALIPGREGRQALGPQQVAIVIHDEDGAETGRARHWFDLAVSGHLPVAEGHWLEGRIVLQRRRAKRHPVPAETTCEDANAQASVERQAWLSPALGNEETVRVTLHAVR